MSTNQTRLHSTLSTFEPIALSDMDAAALLDRVDNKYVLHESRLPELLDKLRNDYFMLEINGCRSFQYQTNYFDTPDLLFYNDHHNGFANRVKIRCREYKDTATSFFEIKRKYRNYRTDKHRKPVGAIMSQLTDDEYSEVRSLYARNDVSNMRMVIRNDFQRITLVRKDLGERCTLDFEIGFTNVNGTHASMNGIAIVEVKQTKLNLRSPVMLAMRSMRAYPNGMSKYVYGMILTTPRLKHHMFKELLCRIEKINPPTITPAPQLNYA